MPLQPRRNNIGDLEALEPIALPLVKGPQYVHPYFPEQENPILHYWQILRKRKWVVLATSAIVFALFVIATLNTTRLYQATSKVAIFPENPNVLGFKDMGDSSSVDYQYDTALETQVPILRSDALAIKGMEAMHLDQDTPLPAVTQLSPPPNVLIPPSS